MAVEVEKKWRRLKHDEALAQFKEELKKTEYLNPPARNHIYSVLKEEQVAIFNKRKGFMKELETLPAENLTKVGIEKLLDTVKNLNDEAQVIYDKRFDELKAQHEHLTSVLNNIREQLRAKLEYYGADLEENQTIDSIILGNFKKK